MKKFLMLLTATTSLTVGTVANLIETANTGVKDNFTIDRMESEDTLKYDVAESGNIISIALPNLLNLFNELNKIHKENNIIIKTYGLPWFEFSTDDGIFDFGWANESLSNIASLINSDYVKFTGAAINLFIINNSNFTAALSYEISDIKQELILLRSQKTGLPIKQEAAKFNYYISYEY